jgi:hypothetical protein
MIVGRLKRLSSTNFHNDLVTGARHSQVQACTNTGHFKSGLYLVEDSAIEQVFLVSPAQDVWQGCFSPRV